MRLARASTTTVRHAAAFVSAAPLPLRPPARPQAAQPHVAHRIPRRARFVMSATPASSQLGLSALRFESSLTAQLPADPESENDVRQVEGAAYSLVTPTAPPTDDVAPVWAEAVSRGQVSNPPEGSPVLRPALVCWSDDCAALFDLPPGAPQGDEERAVVNVLGGFGQLWPGMVPYALNYGGHQFGNWAGQLGDGRAISLGEFVNAAGRRWEIQLKGAGKTPYSRFADGRAVLRSSVREFLCSEAMHFLGVPTTRALSLVTTGAGVVRDMFYAGEHQLEAGAVVARVAPSFLRLGNFQLPASRGDDALLRKTADYAIATHFPHLLSESAAVDEVAENRYAQFVREVAQRNARMVAAWQGIGFVHGVMNTDNFSILGLTIDYGPYGFLDAFDPEYTPNTTDIPGRRYKFSTQPDVAHWNILQFAKAMVSLCGVAPLQKIASEFKEMYQEAQGDVMRRKLGLQQWKSSDRELLGELERCMAAAKADMTKTWRALSKVAPDWTEKQCGEWFDALDVGNASNRSEWVAWLGKYQARVKEDASTGETKDGEDRVSMMNAANPVYILRNYMAQTAIDQANKGDYSEVRRLYELLKRPYEEQEGMEKYTARPPSWASRKGVCVNSCSS